MVEVEPRTSADRGRATGPSVADMSDATVRIVIVDDHRAFAECLSIAIDTHAGLRCVGIAGTMADGLTLIERLLPDIVCLDVRLPDGSGVEAISRIRALSPTSRVLILTAHMGSDVLTRAAHAGASGFLTKESSVAMILGAVRAAMNGEILVEQATLTSIIRPLPRDVEQATTHAAIKGRLTARELDVLRLMGEGLDPHAIAQRLAITYNTCRGYQKAIMAKWGTHSQLETVVVANRRGLLTR